jgi:hypothetical protein
VPADCERHATLLPSLNLFTHASPQGNPPPLHAARRIQTYRSDNNASPALAHEGIVDLLSTSGGPTERLQPRPS